MYQSHYGIAPTDVKVKLYSEKGFVLISNLVAKLLTTTTMAPTARGITGQELVGDLADPTGWAPIIAGPLGGLLVAVTGKLQAHQVPGHLQVNYFNLKLVYTIPLRMMF